MPGHGLFQVGQVAAIALDKLQIGLAQMLLDEIQLTGGKVVKDRHLAFINERIHHMASYETRAACDEVFQEVSSCPILVAEVA